jgi:transaldolase/glucose-6-phosphate isomerase
MDMAITRAANPLVQVLTLGQSLWYDNIRRGLIESGELERMVHEDGLRGVTSNPAIFEKAITGSTDYTAALSALWRAGHCDAKDLYEQLAVRDIRDAADILRPIYEATRCRDGYVSLEVSPALAHDAEATVAEAERLWHVVDRSNLMIKVPATPEGVPAIRHLIGRGINVNVTLLFATATYERVAEAYLAGLEALAADGGDLSRVASVASFFISRIDSEIDARLADVVARGASEGERMLARNLMGKVAIANARLTYQRYKEIHSTPRWHALATRGAQTQRLLWASTSTKNPQYSDVAYVEELIGPDTVDTVPPATFDAFRDHGRPRARLEEGFEEAADVMTTLERLGVSFVEVTDALLANGVEQFTAAFDTLLRGIAGSGARDTEARPGAMTASLGDGIAREVETTLDDWQQGGKVRRLWRRDATLWTGTDEAEWLGWLGIAAEQLAHPEERERIAADVKAAGFTDALLLGMGGSSLAPEMLAQTFGRQEGYPRLHVLDSTDPTQVKEFEDTVDLTNTLFIVSSKSGSTLEPNIFQQYFFDRFASEVGASEAGRHFMAITDPGSKLEGLAQAAHFRHIAHGVPSIGGRYSALSNFGMVPGAIMGVDVGALLDRADRMAHSCVSCVPAADNPGLRLGAIIGVCHNHGRDKLTLITSPRIAHLGAWLEQLLAESTGKHRRGVIPVEGEPLGPPDVYAPDRLFVYVRLGSGADATQDAAVTALEAAGHPVIRIEIDDPYDIGGEIFRWEFATAVAGAVIGINPFDQPDVEASKLATRALTAAYEHTGALPAAPPIFATDGLMLYADDANAQALAMASPASLDDYVRAHLARARGADYVALLAYIPMTATNARALTAVRRLIRDSLRVATTVGFGPRFLHSTGQAYKGGPDTGVVLQITCDDRVDLPIPGQRYTFGVVKAAQARGDFDVLAERGRRLLRVHLGDDVSAGLAALRTAVEHLGS